MSFDFLVFKHFPDGYFVGTNETRLHNAIRSDVDSLTISEVVIPSHYNNQSIIAIGRSAFNECYNIKTVHIHANIREIHFYAFMGCYNLEYINIPASCQYIYQSGLDCRSDVDNTRNNGTFTIVFEPKTQIKYLAQVAIYNAAKFRVYLFDKISPSYVSNFIFGSDLESNTIIYSPYSFRFCGFQTTLFQALTLRNPIYLSFPMTASLFICFNS